MQVKKSSSLRSLDPILVKGVLRVGGRLASTVPEAKHQIILPTKDHMTNLSVEYYHQISGHSGIQYVNSLGRKKVWIINHKRKFCSFAGTPWVKYYMGSFWRILLSTQYTLKWWSAWTLIVF